MPDKIITKLAVEGETYTLKDQALTDNVANNYYTKTETDNRIGKGSLIIQKNGNDLPVNYGNEETKQSFGANDTDACIVNIPVPTQTSELTNNGEGVQDYPFITKAVNNLENYYTISEVNNRLAQLETNIDWKEAVNTYADIATAYQNPQDGWTVNVKDTDYTYRYDGTEWVAISANAIPIATPTTPNTQGVNGLMSTVDKTKLDGIQAGAEVNVQSDWNQSDSTADDYIKNKPTIPTYGNAVSKTGNVVNVLYDNGTWGIGKNQNNQLCINGKFVKQVENLDTYQGAEGEIIEYIGATNDKYTNGHIYKKTAGESITIPSGTPFIESFTAQFACYYEDNSYLPQSTINDLIATYKFPLIYKNDLNNIQSWRTQYSSNVYYMGTGTPQVDEYLIYQSGGNSYKITEVDTVNNVMHAISSNVVLNIDLSSPRTITSSVYEDLNGNEYILFENNDRLNSPCFDNENQVAFGIANLSYSYNPNTSGTVITKYTWTDVYPTSTSELINDAGFITALVNNLTNYYKKDEVDNLIGNGTINVKKNGSTVNSFTTNQKTNTDITLPNDVVMCKMSDGIVYDSYITYTKIKQYLPDYPYYSDDLNWEIGGNPPMRASITEGDYYLDVDTNHIFVADENLELQDVTSTVVIQGDTNKLYCDVDTNILYRYDGTNFVALTSEGKTYTLSSNNENIRLTDNDGQTQDVSLNTLINGLSTGASDPQDDDYIISQYVNGGTTTTTYHRRPLSKFWNWIKSKLGIGTNDGTFLRKDGTWATPTDTKATVTTTGSGNAITSLTASNGALTATKETTFLTSVPKFLDNSDFAISVSDYKCLLISDITDFINSTSVNLPLQGFEGIVISVRTNGYIQDTNNSAFITAMVSYDKNHRVMKTSSSSLYPQVVKYNNKYYIAIRKGTSATTLFFFGYSRNLLSPLLTVDYNDCEIINDYTTTNTIANGGTGATTAANARANLGIGNVGTLTYASDTTKYLRNDGTWQVPPNTWRPLGTGASDACAGNDSRIPTISTTSGSTSAGTYQCAKYGRVAVVSYSGAVTSGISLPAAYKPLINVYEAGATANMTGVIKTDGVLLTSGASGSITFTYITAS